MSSRKVSRKAELAAKVARVAKSAAARVEAPAAVEPVPVEVASSAPAGLKLEASCTLRDSVDMQFQLLAVDFGDSDVRVDGSAVERIDTAGLQMLLSFVKHHAARGKSVKWTGASPDLVRGSQLLGIAGMLGIPDSNGEGEARGH